MYFFWSYSCISSSAEVWNQPLAMQLHPLVGRRPVHQWTIRLSISSCGGLRRMNEGENLSLGSPKQLLNHIVEMWINIVEKSSAWSLKLWVATHAETFEKNCRWRRKYPRVLSVFFFYFLCSHLLPKSLWLTDFLPFVLLLSVFLPGLLTVWWTTVIQSKHH